MLHTLEKHATPHACHAWCTCAVLRIKIGWATFVTRQERHGGRTSTQVGISNSRMTMAKKKNPRMSSEEAMR